MDGIRDLELPELERLSKEIDAVSSTNCGWSTYEAARVIRGEVEWALRRAMDANVANIATEG